MATENERSADVGVRRPAARRLADRALLLRRFPYGESSLVVHALTPEQGRVALLAKGAYRTSSGFFGVLDLFDELELRWTARTDQELGVLTAGRLMVRRQAICADLERYRAALALLELAGLAAREGQEERALFRWLSTALDLLQRGSSAPGLVQVAFDLSFLRAAGLAPALDRCASCGERPTTRSPRARPPDARPPGARSGGVAFSRALGGRLCARCARESRARGRSIEVLPLNLVRVAESLMSATPAMLEHIRIEAALLGRVREFVERFLEHHLETRLRSRGHAFPSRSPRTER